ncbi:excalibur calcium-binding domain-containing protein [Streptomyces sennicomposti]
MVTIPGRTLSTASLILAVLALSSCASEPFDPKPEMDSLKTAPHVGELALHPHETGSVDVAEGLVIRTSILDWYDHTSRYIDEDRDRPIPDKWRSHLRLELTSKPEHGTVKVSGTTLIYRPDGDFTGTGDPYSSADEVGYRLILDGPGHPRLTTGQEPESLLVTMWDTDTDSGDVPHDESTEPSAPYANCADARAHGDTPVMRGDPGYGPHLDRDGDGIGCEWG